MNYKEILGLCLERKKRIRDEEGRGREREREGIEKERNENGYSTEGIKGVAKGNGLPVALR